MVDPADLFNESGNLSMGNISTGFDCNNDCGNLFAWSKSWKVHHRKLVNHQIETVVRKMGIKTGELNFTIVDHDSWCKLLTIIVTNSMCCCQCRHILHFSDVNESYHSFCNIDNDSIPFDVTSFCFLVFFLVRFFHNYFNIGKFPWER